MIWTERILEMKAEQYTKEYTLKYMQDLFNRKDVKFLPKHKIKFELTWKKSVKLNPTVEDIVPEIDLPKDLTKIKDYQKTQVKNYFKRLDKIEMTRRIKLIQIALNIAHVRKKQKDIDSFTELSDLVYEAKLMGRPREESRQIAPVHPEVLKKSLFNLFRSKLMTEEHFKKDKHNWKEDCTKENWDLIKGNEFVIHTSSNRIELQVNDHYFNMLFLGEDYYDDRKYRDTEDEMFEETLVELGKFVKKLGYFVSGHGDLSIKKYIYLEPLYGIPIKPLPRFLYHITSLYNKERIMRKGLIPHKGKLQDYSYPPRVFVALKYNLADLAILHFHIENYHTDIQDMYEGRGEYSPKVVFRIDTTKLSKGIKFFNDPDSKLSAWTYTAIPPKSLSIKWQDDEKELEDDRGYR